MNNISDNSFYNSGQNKPISANVRFLNAVDNLPLDIYSNGDKIYENIEYGKFTDYTSVPPGIYNIEFYRSGDTGNPVEKADESLTVGNSFTIVATGTPDNIKIYQIPEPYTSPTPGLRTYIRLANLSQNAPSLDASLKNGTKLFENVRVNEFSNYYRLVPNIYTVYIKSADTGETLLTVPGLRAQAGRIYTVYIIDSKESNPPYKALFVPDSEYPASYEQ